MSSAFQAFIESCSLDVDVLPESTKAGLCYLLDATMVCLLERSSSLKVDTDLAKTATYKVLKRTHMYIGSLYNIADIVAASLVTDYGYEGDGDTLMSAIKGFLVESPVVTDTAVCKV